MQIRTEPIKKIHNLGLCDDPAASLYKADFIYLPPRRLRKSKIIEKRSDDFLPTRCQTLVRRAEELPAVLLSALWRLLSRGFRLFICLKGPSCSVCSCRSSNMSACQEKCIRER